MPSPPHRIRLRRPWRRDAASEVVRWHRAFQRPTGLEGGASVAVVVDALAEPGSLWLNGDLLGALAAGGPTRFNITSRLAMRNEIVLDIPGDATPGDDPPAKVTLEIRDP